MCIRDSIPYMPTSSKYKVYLIDEVHMLTKESFNSLLKTLEEPPPHVIFMFATTEFSQIPATILSRCLQLNLNSVTLEDLKKQLSIIFTKEKVKYEDFALTLISEAANGSIRDALTISEKIISFSEKNITSSVVREVLGISDDELIQGILKNLKDKNTEELFKILDEINNDSSVKSIFIDLMDLIKNISLTQFKNNKDCSYDSTLLEIEPGTLQIFYQLCLVNMEYIDDSPDPKGLLEMTLLKMLAFDIEEKKNLIIDKPFNNFDWSRVLTELKLSKVFSQHLMQSNGFIHQKDFILSLPKEKKVLINETSIKDLESKLRTFLSIEDLKVVVNTDYDASRSPLSLKEEKLKKNNEIIEEKISNSKSYKKIVSELNPKIKNFDNS